MNYNYVIWALSVSIYFQSLRAQTLLCSQDEGVSWQTCQTALSQEMKINKLIEYNGKLLIGTENHGLYLDGLQIGALLPGRKINNLYVDKDSIYVSVFKYGLYKSVNGGFTWQKIHDGEVRGIEKIDSYYVLGTDEGIVLVDSEGERLVFEEGQVTSIYKYKDDLIAGSVFGVIHSKDGGKSWTYILREGAALNLACDAESIYTTSADGQLLVSNDLGNTWTKEKVKGGFYDVVTVKERTFLTNQDGLFKLRKDEDLWKLIYPYDTTVLFDLLIMDSKLLAGTRSK